MSFSKSLIKLMDGKAEMVKLGAVAGYRIKEQPLWQSRPAGNLNFGNAMMCVSDFDRFERHLSETKYDVIHFNFGLNDPKTVLEIIEAILAVAGRPDLEPIILNQPLHEIHHQYLDSEKARRLLGWEPQWTLEAGLWETLAWYREFFAEEGAG